MNHPRTLSSATYARKHRRAQARIMTDVAAILVFVLASVLFYLVFQGISSASLSGKVEFSQIAPNHRALLQFVKSDVYGVPLLELLEQANSDQIEQIGYGYFNQLFGKQWSLEISYSDKRVQDIELDNHSATFQRGQKFLDNIFSTQGLPAGIQGALLFPSSSQVRAVQVVPLSDGSFVTLTLTTWVIV